MVPASPAGDIKIKEVAPAHPGRDVGSSPLPSPAIAARSEQQQIDAARSSSSPWDDAIVVNDDDFPFGSPTLAHFVEELKNVKVTANNNSYNGPYDPILIEPKTVQGSVGAVEAVPPLCKTAAYWGIHIRKSAAYYAHWASAISSMMSGGITPPSRPSSATSPSMTITDLAAGNYSGTPPPTPTPLSEGSGGTEEGFTSNPHGPPLPPSSSSAGGDNEGSRLTVVIALLAYIAGVMIGILPESDHIVTGWSTVAIVVYGIVVQLTVALLAVGIMSAGCHAARNRRPSVSAWCAKLGAILSSVLLVVAFSCKLG